LCEEEGGPFSFLREQGNIIINPPIHSSSTGDSMFYQPIYYFCYLLLFISQLCEEEGGPFCLLREQGKQ
jgi:hypothetical protein